MMGLGYLSNQYYSFQNAQELKQALQLNNIGIQEIQNDEKIIKYIIDRKQCIRLSDLLFWIKTKFVKFNYGQILDLFEKLLIHAQTLEQQKIDFIYLDENRIWLILEEQSQYLHVTDSILKYKIAFTGFQCPFYDKENMQSSQNSIIQAHIIMINFLQHLIDGKIIMSEHKDSKNEIVKIISTLKISNEDKIIKKFYKPLKEALLKLKISDSLNYISVLKKKLKYDQSSQKNKI